MMMEPSSHYHVDGLNHVDVDIMMFTLNIVIKRRGNEMSVCHSSKGVVGGASSVRMSTRFGDGWWLHCYFDRVKAYSQ